ncbi:hypothetical protein GJ496_011489 [Pomphorhynchus laevis]|nr:hypothetical protein GJ496_011489 [Pomphorhynchus laevis]
MQSSHILNSINQADQLCQISESTTSLNFKSQLTNCSIDAGIKTKRRFKVKPKGRAKTNLRFIDHKSRRYTSFSKRKSGLMKKAYEIATLTGASVMLVVASETGHVYTYATEKFKPLISGPAGKSLLQACLRPSQQIDDNEADCYSNNNLIDKHS